MGIDSMNIVPIINSSWSIFTTRLIYENIYWYTHTYSCSNTYIILLTSLTKWNVICWIGNCREGGFGGCHSYRCNFSRPDLVYLLGCKERPWLQLLGSFLVCIPAGSACLWSDTGLCFNCLNLLASRLLRFYVPSIPLRLMCSIVFGPIMHSYRSLCRFSSLLVRRVIWLSGLLEYSYSVATLSMTQTNWSSATSMMSTFLRPLTCIWTSSTCFSRYWRWWRRQRAQIDDA